MNSTTDLTVDADQAEPKQGESQVTNINRDPKEDNGGRRCSLRVNRGRRNWDDGTGKLRIARYGETISVTLSASLVLKTGWADSPRLQLDYDDETRMFWLVVRDPGMKTSRGVLGNVRASFSRMAGLAKKLVKEEGGEGTRLLIPDLVKDQAGNVEIVIPYAEEAVSPAGPPVVKGGADDHKVC
jgi:hypothetical protein